jgi:hypothetical protein
MSRYIDTREVALNFNLSKTTAVDYSSDTEMVKALTVRSQPSPVYYWEEAGHTTLTQAPIVIRQPDTSFFLYQLSLVSHPTLHQISAGAVL